MKKRQWIIIGAALLILLVGNRGCALLAGMKEVPETKKAETVYRLVNAKEVKNDTLVKQVTINGKLIASEKLEIYPEVTGRLALGSKSFKVGQHYDKGEVLLSIDGSESLLNLKSQRSAYFNLVSQILPDIKIDYENEYQVWRDYLDAIDTNKALPELPEVTSSKLKNFLAGRNLNQQFYAIRSLENRQAKFTITAPFHGTVSMGSVNPGTVIRAGQKVGEFIRDDAFELESALSHSDAKSITVGSPVILEGGIRGKIIRVANNADPQSQRVAVYAAVSGSGLKEGVYMQGVVEVAEIPNTIAVNRNLILDGDQVFIVADSVLVKRPVEVVHRFEEVAMVKGLHQGDLLLDQVIEGAYEGMLVKTESK